MGLLCVCFILSACFSSEKPSSRRAERARHAQGPVIIGAASNWSESDGRQEQGIKLAVKEINANGGVLGRKLELVFADDKASVSTGQIVAQNFADNPDLVAVIGHTESYISVPVSIIYEYYGILMMSPLSTSPKLTEHNFKLIFRNIPNDLAYGIELAHFCKQHRLQRVLIYNVNDEYGTGFANAFENECRIAAVDIVDRAAYDPVSDVKVFMAKLGFWRRNYKFDALFLAAAMPEAAEIVICARRLGLNATILGGDYFDNAEFINKAGAAAAGVIIPSVFQPDNQFPAMVDFVHKFKQEYDEMPSYDAEQGYDAVCVLAQAIKVAKTTEPLKIAETLRSGIEWRGVSDNYSFDKRGNVKGRKIFFKVVKEGGFVLLPD